jgi:hypothetical protein
LRQPSTNLILRISRKFREPQASELSRFIHPGNFSDELNLLRGIGRNAKLKWARVPHGSDGVESKTLFGSIQYDSAALRFELDIAQFCWPLSMNTTAFRIHLRPKAPRF